MVLVFVNGGIVNSVISLFSNIKDNSKRFIRKQAIEQVKENITYQQKKVSDYSREQLRSFILKEEKRIIKGAGLKSVLITTGAIFGITFI